MNCDCINQIDDRLRKQNLKLTGYTFMMPDFRTVPTLATEWVDKDKAPKGMKKKPTAMLASHCPFCGVAVEKKNTKCWGNKNEHEH